METGPARKALPVGPLHAKLNPAKNSWIARRANCYFFFVGVALAAAACFFFWSAAAALVLFCEVSLLVAFGDLSPIITAFTLLGLVVFVTRWKSTLQDGAM